MKRILSVVGARPNFMKVAPIHRAFEAYSDVEHRIVHTGQHYDAAMSDAFFNDLDMPTPAYFLGVGSGSHAVQTAKVMSGFEDVCLQASPDYVIVVGDVNSTVACALTAVKMGIRTAHVEAGLRSGDRGMPEEINRLATDAIADDLFVTETSAIEHLLREGHKREEIHFVGNTMIDSMHYALPKAERSGILGTYGLDAGKYALATLHRPSNVDSPQQLTMLMEVIRRLAQSLPVVFPVHPRTRKHLDELGIAPATSDRVHLIDPVGYVDFLALMKSAAMVITDSGGIQEETTALGVPCITARTTTERPVTITIGTNRLVEPAFDQLIEACDTVINSHGTPWQVPPLWDGNAAGRIAKIIHAALTLHT